MPLTWSAFREAIVDTWLAERCNFGPSLQGSRALASDLKADFDAWLRARGDDPPISATAFGRQLTLRGVRVSGKDCDGLKYRGPIRLKPVANAVRRCGCGRFLKARG